MVKKTFCRECKDTSTITKDDSCPLCRSFFRIPEEGCGSIPRNDFMEKLIDLHEAHLERELKLKGEKKIGRLSLFSYSFIVRDCSLVAAENAAAEMNAAVV